MISLPAVLGLTNSEHQVEMEPTAEQHHRVKKDEFEKVQVRLPHLFDQIFEAAFDRRQQWDVKGLRKIGICELPRRGMVSLGWLVISP